MTGLTRFAEGSYASGQPAPADLADLARTGVRTVINLRTPGEAVEYDEPGEVAKLGLRYVALPTAGAADLDVERVEAFGRAMDEALQQGGVLVHCASSNRVGALVALDHALNRGGALSDALALGRAAGLTSLEPVVIEVIERRLSTR